MEENKVMETVDQEVVNQKEEIERLTKEVEELKKVLKEGKVENHIFFGHSKDMSDIDKGMIEFHKKLEAIDRSGNNTFLKYKYATLDDILSEVNPKLAEEGLYIMQFPINIGENELAIRTMLRSNSGQFIVYDSVGFKYRADIQLLGSFITYIKRYALSAILAVNLSEDTDCGETKTPAENSQQAETTSNTPTRRRRG